MKTIVNYSNTRSVRSTFEMVQSKYLYSKCLLKQFISMGGIVRSSLTALNHAGVKWKNLYVKEAGEYVYLKGEVASDERSFRRKDTDSTGQGRILRKPHSVAPSAPKR